jgi:hypothetical protein
MKQRLKEKKGKNERQYTPIVLHPENHAMNANQTQPGRKNEGNRGLTYAAALLSPTP